ncbi:alpha-hydroxy acid oxidase [Dactylosporangium fulvum]|uniref:Alpha-hydroxy-acid oxidizing protein n=1 Tax=Dactylosporangium fulvum TaxID=53359 RepID=A0ABY5W8H9_9ACTN|nr:alpha-hydroxy acid oxidase [Dactylosporangium fulvum]UWP85519.1 alpha-hydroxy-acid oxidizing protein [Dactylosporangium fulvum]
MARRVTIEDYRRIAKRRLPRFVFDYVDGAAGDELTMRDNIDAFQKIRLYPNQQVDVSRRSTATTVLGRQVEMPVLLAPTGLQRLVHRRADLEVAAAAGRAGVPFVVSASTAFTIEEIAANATGDLWIQIYPWRDRAAVEHVVKRALDAGYSTLVVTVDVPLLGRRERDVRNGMSIPPRITARNLYEGARHPRWVTHLLRGPEITFTNFSSFVPDSRGMALMSWVNNELTNPGAQWDEVRWLRSLWPGPMVVKGILTRRDALLAVGEGADAVVVSNHGGRQLDGTPATVDVLPRIVDAVPDRVEVLLDGGVRRGTDVLKALALGARAVLIGRPYWWGLAAGGSNGVRAVLEVLRAELDMAMALSGRPTIESIGPDLLAPPD